MIQNERREDEIKIRYTMSKDRYITPRKAEIEIHLNKQRERGGRIVSLGERVDEVGEIDN